jgi:hypothetical protein
MGRRINQGANPPTAAFDVLLLKEAFDVFLSLPTLLTLAALASPALSS